MQVKAALARVKEALAVWRDEGRMLPFWWRDDDATTPGPALDRLLSLAAGLGAPLHLAVIPEPASPDLAGRLASSPGTLVLPHGWRHRNNAPAGEKKAEFGAHRPPALMLGEIQEGWRRIQDLFGARALPVFTPPWNRVAPAVVEMLPGAGLLAVSTYKPRRQREAAPGVLQVNTHADPIDWSRGGLLDPSRIAADFVTLLSERREGMSSNEEPFGLLTHHLVHDEAIWNFIAALLEVLLRSGAVGWKSPLAEVDC